MALPTHGPPAHRYSTMRCCPRRLRSLVERRFSSAVSIRSAHKGLRAAGSVLRAKAQQRSARRQIFGRLDQDLWRLRFALHIGTRRSPACLNTVGDCSKGRLQRPPTPGQFATVKATAHNGATKSPRGGPKAEDPLDRNKGSCAYPYPRASARPGSRRSQTYERKRPPGNISDPPRNRIAPLVSDGPSSMADSVGARPP